MKVVMDVGSMLQKWLVVSVFVIEISFWGDDAHCQFFPLELSNSDSDNPADFSIRIASESPCALTKHHSKVLARHQQHLDAAVDDFKRLSQQKEHFVRRLSQVSVMLNEKKRKVNELSESENGEEPNLDSDTPDNDSESSLALRGQVEALENLKRVLRVVIDRTNRAEDIFSEERQSISSGFMKVDMIIAECDRKPHVNSSEVPEKSIKLLQALSVSQDLYLAELDLSLARSRQRAFEVEDDQYGSPDKASGTLQENVPMEIREPFDRQNNVSNVEVRMFAAETTSITDSIDRLNRLHQFWMRIVTQTSYIVATLDVYIKNSTVDAIRQQLDIAVDLIVVTGDEIEKQKKVERLLQKKNDAEITKLRKAHATLRANTFSNHFGVGSEITSSYLKEIQGVAMKERIRFLEQEKAHSLFVERAYEVLYQLQKEKIPTQEFLESQLVNWNNVEILKRKRETIQEREAWRRQRIKLSERQVISEQKDIHEEILHMIDEIIDRCTKQEQILESSQRLASIMKARLSSLNLAPRNFWWYFRGSALSLLCLALTISASVFWNRGMLAFSHRSIAFTEHQLLRVSAINTKSFSPNLHKAVRYTCFNLYIAGMILLWSGVVLLSLKLIWDRHLEIADIPTMMGATWFMIGEKAITLSDILKMIAIVVATIISTRFLQAFLNYQVFHFFEWDAGVKHAIAVVLRYIMILIGFSLGLEYLGIGLEMFAVLLGVIGIGIGFGLQKLAANYVSGFVILFSRPVKKGDYITVADDLEGEIIEMGMRTTTVRTRDNISVILPNADIVSEKVINWSYGDTTIRLRVPVGVAYGSNIDAVEEVLLDVARRHGEVHKLPIPVVWFTAFGESALEFELLVWVSNIKKRFLIVSDLNREIDNGFRDRLITVPFPQRDIHIITDSPAK
jgi:small-conductance mechanosensitive channel